MRALFVALVSLAAASFSAAQDGQWKLVQSVGEVTIEEPGLAKIAVKPNASLSEGATVTTGANGRAILTDGRSSITVNANSRIELPAANEESVTSIRQDFGKAIFKVQKKPTAHFEVQTPYLAAVVKGTTFEVTVDAMGASVDVEEGLVDVGATASGERTLVPGGQRVRVLRSGRFDGGRPADTGRDRQTIAALNVIDIEIAPEADTGVGQEREFAALQPKFENQEGFQDRAFDVGRDRDEGGSGSPAPASAGADDNGVGARPPEPDVAPSSPASGGSSGGGAAIETRDDAAIVRADRHDRDRWAAFLAKLKEAYNDWKSRSGSDRYSWDRGDD